MVNLEELKRLGRDERAKAAEPASVVNIANPFEPGA
jgi:hypothetical protein